MRHYGCGGGGGYTHLHHPLNDHEGDSHVCAAVWEAMDYNNLYHPQIGCPYPHMVRLRANPPPYIPPNL